MQRLMCRICTLELVGEVEGIISNSINFVATPYEFVLDTKNKENT